MRHGTMTNGMNKDGMLGDLFTNEWTHEACQVLAEGIHARETSSKHQDHWRLHTPSHAEVKLCYTKSTLII